MQDKFDEMYGPGLAISDYHLGVLYMLAVSSLATYGILLAGLSQRYEKIQSSLIFLIFTKIGDKLDEIKEFLRINIFETKYLLYSIECFLTLLDVLKSIFWIKYAYCSLFILIINLVDLYSNYLAVSTINPIPGKINEADKWKVKFSSTNTNSSTPPEENPHDDSKSKFNSPNDNLEAQSLKELKTLHGIKELYKDREAPVKPFDQSLILATCSDCLDKDKRSEFFRGTKGCIYLIHYKYDPSLLCLEIPTCHLEESYTTVVQFKILI